MNESEQGTITQLSIVIPVYNEEDNVLPLATEVAEVMQRVNMPYELVFVDDASGDQTWQRIAEARQKCENVRGLRLNRRSGQSAAVWTGIQATNSPLIATLDGDRQNNPEDLPRLLREARNFDFVCGVRAKRNDSWTRRVSTKAARWARRKVFKIDFADTGCAFRVFRRSAIDGLFPFDGIHRFLPVLVHTTGATTRQVPISHRARTAGVSKYGVWNRLWRGIYDLIAVAWWQKRRIGKIGFTALDPNAPIATEIPIPVSAAESEEVQMPATETAVAPLARVAVRV